jgi:hypothetical protein
MPVADWVKKMVEDNFPCHLEIGKTVQHRDGRNVLIIAGQFWGTHGISNFWHWREVLPNGTLGPKECGYGW